MKQKKTLAEYNPTLAAQWHPTKNGTLTPSDVPPKANRAAWWLGPCGHEWEATINNRANGTRCPYCTGKKVLPGFNDLASQMPHIAAQWHPTKNGGLTPEKIGKGSNRKVWWLCPDCGHEWQATPMRRANGAGCLVCAPQKRERTLIEERGSLLDHSPHLAAQWHPAKNGELTPAQVTSGSGKRVWWLCPDCGHEWQAVISSRAKSTGCPRCLPQRKTQMLLQRRGSLRTNNPALAAQWHPTKNGALTPDQVTAKSGKKVWWLCPSCGHEWESIISIRAGGAGCPICGHKLPKSLPKP